MHSYLCNVTATWQNSQFTFKKTRQISFLDRKCSYSDLNVAEEFGRGQIDTKSVLVRIMEICWKTCGLTFQCATHGWHLWETRDRMNNTRNREGLHRYTPLQWRHNERDGVSNHRCLDCLLEPMFRRRQKTSKLRVTSLCNGNSPATGQ